MVSGGAAGLFFRISDPAERASRAIRIRLSQSGSVVGGCGIPAADRAAVS